MKKVMADTDSLLKSPRERLMRQEVNHRKDLSFDFFKEVQRAIRDNPDRPELTLPEYTRHFNDLLQAIADIYGDEEVQKALNSDWESVQTFESIARQQARAEQPVKTGKQGRPATMVPPIDVCEITRPVTKSSFLVNKNHPQPLHFFPRPREADGHSYFINRFMAIAGPDMLSLIFHAFEFTEKEREMIGILRGQYVHRLEDVQKQQSKNKRRKADEEYVPSPGPPGYDIPTRPNSDDETNNAVRQEKMSKRAKHEQSSRLNKAMQEVIGGHVGSISDVHQPVVCEQMYNHMVKFYFRQGECALLTELESRSPLLVDRRRNVSRFAGQAAAAAAASAYDVNFDFCRSGGNGGNSVTPAWLRL